MSDISAWSEIADNNQATPPHGWPEGQDPSSVNNCAREMMAQIKKFWNSAVGSDVVEHDGPSTRFDALRHHIHVAQLAGMEMDLPALSDPDDVGWSTILHVQNGDVTIYPYNASDTINGKPNLHAGRYEAYFIYFFKVQFGDRHFNALPLHPQSRVSSDDGEPGDLYDKIVAGDGVEISTTNPSGSEQLSVSTHLHMQDYAISFGGTLAPGRSNYVGPGVPGSLFLPGGTTGAALSVKSASDPAAPLTLVPDGTDRIEDGNNSQSVRFEGNWPSVVLNFYAQTWRVVASHGVTSITYL